MPIKPTTQEEAFFAKQEIERKRKAVQENMARIQVKEQEERMKPMRCGKNVYSTFIFRSRASASAILFS